MFQFFPIFAYAIEQISSEEILIGNLKSLNDVDLSDGKSVSVYKIVENQEIKDQGFESQYRLKIDFDYGMMIFSTISESDCNEMASEILETMSPGIDIHLTYNGTSYSIYINKIKDEIVFKPEINSWVETLVFTGFTIHKEE